jgi:hypothetical protein
VEKEWSDQHDVNYGQTPARPLENRPRTAPLHHISQQSERYAKQDVAPYHVQERNPAAGIPPPPRRGHEWLSRITEAISKALNDERQRSAGENGASDLHFKEKSERHFRSVASFGSSGFGGGIVLVLSIAVLVLVLVLETLLGYSVGSLYQSSEHRHDPF